MPLSLSFPGPAHAEVRGDAFEVAVNAPPLIVSVALRQPVCFKLLEVALDGRGVEAKGTADFPT